MTMPPSSHKRVLCVDAVAFHRGTDMGILKSNLFGDWPSDRLSQVLIGNDEPDFSICSEYWRITRQDRVVFGGGVRLERPTQGDEPTAEARGSRRSGPGATAFARADRFRRGLGALAWCAPLHLTRQLRTWLSERRPEVIFTFAASLGVMSAARRLSDHLNVPLIPYFTDDWIEWLHKKDFPAVVLRQKLEKAFADTLARSSIRLTISEAMARAYSERYGGRFEPRMDVVNLHSMRYEPYRVTGERTRLVFMGYLEPDRWRSLKNLGDAVRVLRAEGHDVSLDVYTFSDHAAKYGPFLHDPPSATILTAVPPQEVARVLGSADILVHVESFHLEDKAKIAFSLSTKIPQYLAAGRAILGYGPSKVASMQYLAATGGGLVVGEPAGSELLDTLRRLVSTPQLRISLATNGRQVARTNHDAHQGREHFRKLVEQGSL